MTDATLAMVESHFGIALDADRRQRALATDPVDRDAGDPIGRARRIVEEIVPKETHFFRSPEQFAVLAASLEGSRPQRLLSIGCATGEEPFSMAITALERRGPRATETVAIDAIDVSEGAIRHAERGLYRAWALRSSSEEVMARHFAVDDERYRVKEPALSMVRFVCVNALSPGALPAGVSYDAIFCRNLLMYMTEEASEALLTTMVRALRPGGLLFLGYAETARGRRPLVQPVRCGGAFYFRRTGGPESARGAAILRHSVPPPSGARAWPLVADSPRTLASALLLPHVPERPDRPPERHRGAPEPPRSPPAPAARASRSAQLPEDRDRLAYLAWWSLEQGDLRQALLAANRIVALDDLDPAGHHLLALGEERAGRRASAEEHGRRAVYLEPRFALAHLHLALMALEAADHERARRGLRRAAQLLEQGQRGPVSADFDDQALIALCRSELRRLGGDRAP